MTSSAEHKTVSMSMSMSNTESSWMASVAMTCRHRNIVDSLSTLASGEGCMAQTHKMVATNTGSSEDKGNNSGITRQKNAGTTALERAETTGLESAETTGSWAVAGMRLASLARKGVKAGEVSGVVAMA